MFIICEICPADHLKVGKKGVRKAVSSLFAILCHLFLSQIWSYEFFLSTCTRKGTNMFNGPANLWKFHFRKRNKSCSKDPYFLCRKTLRNGIELRQDLHLSMRKLSSLSPFGNLSCCVLFSVDLFFWRIEPPRYFVTLKAPAIFTPRSRAIKKPYGASLKDKYKKNAQLKQTRSLKHYIQAYKHQRITENSLSLLATKFS